MKSFSLLRTNVGLTTNAKIMVGSNYALYMDAIISIPELSTTKYKKLQFNKDSAWDSLIPTFFKDTPANIAFAVEYDFDNDKMSTDFANQYDDTYQYGARNIIENKDYGEEYEYLAPLYISKTGLPTNFIIFRVDGAGLGRVDSENFRAEIINKLKCVKNFDLTRKSQLGEWIDKNIISNKNFPPAPAYIDFRSAEFSTFYGIDYSRGGFVEKSVLLDSALKSEQTILDGQKLLYDNFRNNNLVFPHIINFSFLFDDTPATPSSVRRWSLNRYLGFYMDALTEVTKITPYSGPALRSDVIIDNDNFLVSPSSDSPYEQAWKRNQSPFVEIGGQYYTLEIYEEVSNKRYTRVQVSPLVFEDQFINPSVTRYKIISDANLAGRQAELNQNLVQFSYDGSTNTITKPDGSIYTIPNFDSADVWLIEIGGTFHNLQVASNGSLTLRTDWAFSQNAESLTWYIINQTDPRYRKSVSLNVVAGQQPPQFPIYKCKFTEIRDFDLDIVDTGFARYEYEIQDRLPSSTEPQLYRTNLDSVANPKNVDDFRISGQVSRIPAASEYTANNETFRIVDNDLTPLWRKNPEHCKWGFQNSLSTYDYPYLFNNSQIAEDFNRAPIPISPVPNRYERNLDYFVSLNTNVGTYSFQSLHIQDTQFDLLKYLGIGYDLDYFSYFFGKKTTAQGGSIIEAKSKWSLFNPGDTVIPNTTLWRGLKFSISDVVGTRIGSTLENLNLKNSNNYQDYKFAVLLSTNQYNVIPTADNVNTATVSVVNNLLKWVIIDEWRTNTTYQMDSIVVWNDILYQAYTQSNIENPSENPANSSSWTEYVNPTILWSPNFDGTGLSPTQNNMSAFGNIPPLVWNAGEYYFSTGGLGNNFWDPSQTYTVTQVVLFKNKLWVATNTSQGIQPGDLTVWIDANGDRRSFWSESTTANSIWTEVPVWSDTFDYSQGTGWAAPFLQGYYVYHAGAVWGIWQTVPGEFINSIPPQLGLEPTLGGAWVRIHQLGQDTEYVYGNAITNNNLIFTNGKYYLCVDNPNDSTLENGICVYLNKKHKNILVNIYVNDNTFKILRSGNRAVIENQIQVFTWQEVSNLVVNTERDVLYTELFQKLVVSNFMNALNDTGFNKWDFSDDVKYVMVEPSGQLKIYDFSNLNSISGLPFFLSCDDPDILQIKDNSLIYTAETLSPSQIKSNRKLDGGNITTLENLNWYTEISFASRIDKNLDDPKLVANFSGLRNIVYRQLYRHSGWYGPITTQIPLFQVATLTQSGDNYKFDTTFTHFGTMRQRIWSKINRRRSVLKLKNNPNLKSIYPMLDEFGYGFSDFFIFKSSWDFDFHTEVLELPPNLPVNTNQSLVNNNR